MGPVAFVFRFDPDVPEIKDEVCETKGVWELEGDGERGYSFTLLTVLDSSHLMLPVLYFSPLICFIFSLLLTRI